jgi:predicted nucleotidyltransferase
MIRRQLQKDIQQVIDQVVALAHPRRIFLFGSGADGTAGEDSDLDFLVVTDDDQQPATLADRLNVHVRNKPMPCDFLVVTESALHRQRSNPGLIYAEILDRGRQVYAA